MVAGARSEPELLLHRAAGGLEREDVRRDDVLEERPVVWLCLFCSWSALELLDLALECDIAERVPADETCRVDEPDVALDEVTREGQKLVLELAEELESLIGMVDALGDGPVEREGPLLFKTGHQLPISPA